jgi:ribosome maturation factor RimP
MGAGEDRMIGGNEIRNELAAHVDAIARTLADIEVVKCTVVRERGTWVVRVVVDRDGGISIDLCEDINRRLAQRIDEMGQDAPEYQIEVESAGLERQLYTPANYRRFAGRRAKVVTSQSLGNRVEFTGPIIAADDVAVVIDDPHAGATAVPYAIIKHARLVYDPRSDLKKSRRA